MAGVRQWMPDMVASCQGFLRATQRFAFFKISRLCGQPNKKRNTGFWIRHALTVFGWLALNLLARGNEDQNSLLPAEQFVQTNLSNSECDLANNTNGSSAISSRTISGKFLEKILTVNARQLSHDGLCLKNANIEGAVDLSQIEVPISVRLEGCHFKADVDLSGAHFDHDLSFEGSVFDGEFHASALRVDGSLDLKTRDQNIQWKTDSWEIAPDETRLNNYLHTNQWFSHLLGSNDVIFDTNRLTRNYIIADPRVVDSNSWTNHFEATVCGNSLFLVQIYDDSAAQISNPVMNLTVGPLFGQWPVITNTGALDLDYLRQKLKTNKSLIYISGNILTTNAGCAVKTIRWSFNPAFDPVFPMLLARWDAGIRTQSVVTFFQPTIFRKGLWLDRAVVNGKLDAGEVEFHEPVDCSGLKVGDSISMDGSDFDNDVRFTHAQVGYDFDLQNCVFAATNKTFDAYGLNVGGSLIIDRARFGSRAEFGETFVGKAFRGQYARFENRDALAEFHGLTVEGLVSLLRAQFAGPANFILSHVKGNFEAQGATFEDQRTFQELQDLTGNTFTFNVDFGSIQVDGFAIFENVLFVRSVSFRNARFGNLYLDGVRWPDKGVLMSYTNSPTTNSLLRLEGMDFQTIRDITGDQFLHTETQLEESQRNLLAMFGNYSPYSFDIYAKLEAYFQREGTPKLADEVFIKAKEREGKEATSFLDEFTNALLDWTVGYGRQPWKAFCESLVCVFIFGLLYRCCMTDKSSSSNLADWWLALFLSLSTFLPFISLGAEELWDFESSKKSIRYLIATEKILGYILVPLWTISLAGLIK